MKKGIRITIIVAICGLFFALAIYNSLHPAPKAANVWNDAMTIGNKETATHHFIMYTDIFCPYCDKFSNAVTANWDEFNEKYIDGQNILFELRVTDMNYLSGHSKNSLPAAEGAYCAAKQDKFWGYYHELLAKLYEDYHSKGIGAERDSKEHIPELEMEYFYDAAEKGGLDRSSFVSCMENHETKAEVDKNTSRASNLISGLPYFTFDNFATSGFMGEWDAMKDYENVKLMMEAGLSTK